MSFLAHLGQGPQGPQGPQLGDFSLKKAGGCCPLTAKNPLERDCTSFAGNTPATTLSMIYPAQLWPWLPVITGYFNGIIHSINGVISTYN